MRPGETVTFRVLGPIEAVVDGRPVDLGPQKRRLVLALLLLGLFGVKLSCLE